MHTAQFKRAWIQQSQPIERVELQSGPRATKVEGGPAALEIRLGLGSARQKDSKLPDTDIRPKGLPGRLSKGGPADRHSALFRKQGTLAEERIESETGPVVRNGQTWRNHGRRH